MPTIKTVCVHYQRKFNLGDYQSAAIGIDIWADVTEEEDLGAAMQRLKDAKRQTEGEAMQALKKILSKYADLFATVKAWDNGGLTMDRYAIAIGEDLWFMSAYPSYPNEVCMCNGQRSSDYESVYLGKPTSLEELPITVLEQIVILAKETLRQKEA